MGKKKEGLGRALIKDRFSKNRHKKLVEDNSLLHTTEINDGYEWGRLNLQSVTAESSLQEFISTAELADKEFTAEKLNIKYVKSAPSEVKVVTSQPDFDEPLTVPRRPKWEPGVSVDAQLEKERDSYLEWRRHLNELQEKLGAALTPYERNIELWRQLWRTLERSDIVLLLLDARNPLLFRCSDLEQYAKEQNCKVILLLNKADLIEEYERQCWTDYFNKENTRIIFFTAAAKTTKCAEGKKLDDIEESNSTESGSDSEDLIEKDNEKEQSDNIECDIDFFMEKFKKIDRDVEQTEIKLKSILERLNSVVSPQVNTNNFPIKNINLKACDDKSTCDIFDRDMLLKVLRSYKDRLVMKQPPKLNIGMIGYPNVGKSSTVNILMDTKKVSVSSMPGHTRHIQSLLLDDDIQILDCPGLVLPAYAVTPDLLLTAVLPIDQMRSPDGAMARLCELMDKCVVEKKYGLLLPKHDEEPNVLRFKEVLTSYAFNRGFMTAAGSADSSRAARIMLKDAASGRLKWSVLPPGVQRLQPQSDGATTGSTRLPTPRELRAVEGWNSKSAEIDRQFFASHGGVAHVKGKPIVGILNGNATGSQDLTAKPWKQQNKHQNKNKREKLRRLYSHLDQH